MILLDTHAMVFDALSPERLSPLAQRSLDEGAAQGLLACSGLSLWEVAMLIHKGRLDPGMPTLAFLDDLLGARSIRVLPITPAIAAAAQSGRFTHGDPADRLIAATA